MRNSFIFLKSYFEAISELPEKDQGKIYKAVIEYAMTGKEPNLTGVLKGYFSLIKPNIDSNNSKYDVKSENGKKGGNPNFKKGQSNPYYAKNEDNLKDNLEISENVFGDNLKDNQEITERINEEITLNMNMNMNKEKENPLKGGKESETSPLSTRPPKKKKYGKYKNVLLTEQEHEALLSEPDGKEAIEFFSEYREMKGYKAKNDNLAIRKWAFLAVKEARQRQCRVDGKTKPKEDLYRHEYTKDELDAVFDSLDDVEI